MRRRIHIVAFERTRLVRAQAVATCPLCQSNEGLLTSAQAAALVQVGEPSIRRWFAQGRAHGIRTSGGQLRICRRSLFREDDLQTEFRQLEQK